MSLSNRSVFSDVFLGKPVRLLWVLLLLFFVITGVFQFYTVSVSRHRQTLIAMGIISPYRPYLSFTIQSMYRKHVHEVWVDGVSGKIFKRYKKGRYPLYVVGKSIFSVEHYAFPFVFQGAYGPVEGIMAIDGDGATITGFKIFREYEQGLGSRAGQSWFSTQFKGKRISDYSGNYVGLKIVSGRLEDKVPASDLEWTVRGIQGALATNSHFELGLAQILQRYEAFSKHVRTTHARKFSEKSR